MIDENKVILMTRMAKFIKHEGKNDARINEYFRSDYVSFQTWKSAISATICFVVLFAVYVVLKFEDVINDLSSMDFVGFGRKVFFCYLIVVITYCVISYIVYNKKYTKVRNKMKKYYNDLKKLRKMYEKD